jgi:hypothetical protein
MAARNAPVASTPVGAFTTGANCAPVVYNPLSGVRGSPYDAKKANPANPNGAFIANTDDLTTGAAITGIGFSANNLFQAAETNESYKNFASVIDADGAETGFVPGLSGNIDGLSGTLLAIGGGYCEATTDGIAHPYPWHTPFAGIGFMGNGTERDLLSSTPDESIASPAVYATVDSVVANGATFEVGAGTFTNRTGKTLQIGDAAALIFEVEEILPPPYHTVPYPSL